jgi:hypothetical protein
MTLLASQVESFRGNLTFPYPHTLSTDLHHASLAEEILNSTEIPYTIEYSVEDNEAVAEIDMTFNTPEQVSTYLLFEQRFIIAQLLKATAAKRHEKKKLFTRRQAVAQDEVIIERCVNYYAHVMSLMLTRTELHVPVTQEPTTVN